MNWSQSLVVSWIECMLGGAVVLLLAKLVLSRLCQPADRIRLIEISMAAAVSLPLLIALSIGPTWSIGILPDRDREPDTVTETVNEPGPAPPAQALPVVQT